MSYDGLDETETGVHVQITDSYGRHVFNEWFDVDAWANPRLGFPPPGHVTQISLWRNGECEGIRFVQNGPGYEPVGPPPWPVPPMDVVFGPPIRQPQFNGLTGLGSPAAVHEVEAEAARKRALAHTAAAAEALENGSCIGALYSIRSASYSMGEFASEAEGVGGDTNSYGYALLGVSQALEVVEGSFVKKCLRK